MGQRALALRALACLVAGALALAASAATAGAAVRCGVHRHAISGIAGSRVLSAQGDVVVYRVRHRSFDTYWACSRTHRRRVLIGRDDSYSMRYELYGPTKAFTEIRTAGDWVTAIHEEDNSPECGKYGETECEGRSTTLVVINVALGLSVHENVYFPGGETAKWLLSPQGGVVWLEDAPAELHGCAATVVKGKLSCPEITLSTGHIEPSSIHLSGTTLTWTAPDGIHSAAV
jgi:hypothetical protein